MGLLDDLYSDPAQMGLAGIGSGLLAAAGPSRMPVSMGQAIAQAMQQGQAGYKTAMDMKKENIANQLQMAALAQALRQGEITQSVYQKILDRINGAGTQSASPVPVNSSAAAFGVMPASAFGAEPGTDGTSLPAVRPVQVAPQSVTQSAPQTTPSRSGMFGMSDDAVLGGMLAGPAKLGEGIMTANAPTELQKNNRAFNIPDDVQRAATIRELAAKGISISSDGKALYADIGADGKPRVVVPTGALDAFKGYATAGEEAKSPFEIGTYSIKDNNGQFRDIQMPKNLALSLMTGQAPSNTVAEQAATFGNANNLPVRVTGPQPNPALGSGTMFSKPSAEESGAIAAQNAGLATTATGAATAGQAYQNTLNDKVEQDRALVQRNARMAPLLDKFSTGGIMPDERNSIANAIQNTGMLPDGAKATLLSWVASGDPTVGKVLENQLSSAGISTLLQTLDKEGKPNRAEFQVLNDARESLKSGNATLKDVFALQRRMYDIHYGEQQALNDAIKAKTYDPRTWTGDYSKLQHAALDAPQPALPSDNPAPAVSSTIPKIKTNADYDALPPGPFIDPFGQTRIKPKGAK